MSGNEFLTVFNGKTGAAITTIDYVPGRGVTKNWGANTSARFGPRPYMLDMYEDNSI